MSLIFIWLPRHQYFEDTKNKLQTFDSGTVSLVETVNYSNMSVNDMIDYLKKSTFFVIHTHGYQMGFMISTTVAPQWISMDDIADEDLSNVSIALLLTCETGRNYSADNIINNTPVNIVEQLAICGVETVVGFKEETYVSDCNLFATQFTALLVDNEYSVEDAIEAINYTDYVTNMSHIDVVAGNANNKLAH